MEKYQRIGEQLINEHVEFLPFTDVVDMGVEELENTNPEDIVSFGYNFLDDKLTGLFPSELVVIGGESGTGKTTFATNIIYKASEKHKCCVLALEDRLADYGIKAVYFEMGRIRAKEGKKNYPWNDYRKNIIKDPDYKAYREKAQEYLKNDNVFFGNVKKQMSIEMLERVLETQAELGTKLILIDHLHYFDLSRGKSTKADYVEQVMVSMKQKLNQTGMRCLLVVHYKKLEGMKPSLDSFKDSISIVQNANYVINLWRDRSMKDDEANHFETQMFIPKSRNPNGECSFDLLFDPDKNDYVFKSVRFGSPLSTNTTEYADF